MFLFILVVANIKAKRFSQFQNTDLSHPTTTCNCVDSFPTTGCNDIADSVNVRYKLMPSCVSNSSLFVARKIVSELFLIHNNFRDLAYPLEFHYHNIGQFSIHSPFLQLSSVLLSRPHLFRYLLDP